MNISSVFATGYAAKTAAVASNLVSSVVAAPAAKTSDTVSISQVARNTLATANAAQAHSVETRLAEIKAKDGLMGRTQEEWDFLFANDKKLAEITEKRRQNPNSLTAAEIDYDQKARGAVNTMANLSPAEKTLYDKAVAGGDTQAAAGISQIAFIRTMGHTAGGANGTTYDPLNTEITAANIERYFSHSIVDPSGKAQEQFQALMQFLQKNSTA
jgi:hypothetical protein